MTSFKKLGNVYKKNVMTCSCNHCYHGHAKNVFVLVMFVTVNNVINTEGAVIEA